MRAGPLSLLTSDDAPSVFCMTKALKICVGLASVLFCLTTTPVKAGAQEASSVCKGVNTPSVSSKVSGRHVFISAKNTSSRLRPTRYKVTWNTGSGTTELYTPTLPSGDAQDAVAPWVAMLGSQAGRDVAVTYAVQAEYLCGKKSVLSGVGSGSRTISPVAAPVIHSVSQTRNGEIMFKMGNLPKSGFVSIAAGCCVEATLPVSEFIYMKKVRGGLKIAYFSFVSNDSGASLNSNTVTLVTR